MKEETTYNDEEQAREVRQRMLEIQALLRRKREFFTQRREYAQREIDEIDAMLRYIEKTLENGEPVP